MIVNRSDGGTDHPLSADGEKRSWKKTKKKFSPPRKKESNLYFITISKRARKEKFFSTGYGEIKTYFTHATLAVGIDRREKCPHRLPVKVQIRSGKTSIDNFVFFRLKAVSPEVNYCTLNHRDKAIFSN